MLQTERIYKIRNLLDRRKVVTISEILNELEVSRSSVKRDLDYMRNRLKIPVEYNREAGGYSLKGQSTSSVQVHELPGLWFSSNEIRALLTMQHLLKGLDAGGVLSAHIEPLMDRLNELLGSTASDSQELRQRVFILSLARRSIEPKHFQTIGSALLQRKRMKITYFARHDGKTSEREVSPQRLVHYRENWYLDAWCHLRKGLRNFALDAISAARSLEITATEMDALTLQKTFDSGYGIFAGGEVHWAKLRFSAERARWVSKEQWHPDQRSSFRADGSYDLQIPFTDHRELIMDVLKHGSHCEVLRPVTFRRAVAEELKRMCENYSGQKTGGSSGEPLGG